MISYEKKYIVFLLIGLLFLSSCKSDRILIPAFNAIGYYRYFACVDGKVFSRQSNNKEETVSVPNHPVISGYITTFVDCVGNDYYLENGICNFLSPILGKGTPYCYVDENTIIVLDEYGYWEALFYECNFEDWSFINEK